MKTFAQILTMISFLGIIQASAMGLGDWQHQTPGGNTMEDPGNGITLRLKRTTTEIYPIEKWYFYKHFIVGKTNKNYFVLNENNDQLLQFTNLTDWTNYIYDGKLDPIIWTRWYTDNWVDNDYIQIMLLLGSPFIIALIIGLTVMTYRRVKKDKYRFDYKYVILLLAPIIIYSIVIVLDKYPDSI